MLQTPRSVDPTSTRTSPIPLSSFQGILILNKNMCIFNVKKPKPQRPGPYTVMVMAFQIHKHYRDNVSIPTFPSSKFSECDSQNSTPLEKRKTRDWETPSRVNDILMSNVLRAFRFQRPDTKPSARYQNTASSKGNTPWMYCLVPAPHFCGWEIRSQYAWIHA